MVQHRYNSFSVVLSPSYVLYRNVPKDTTKCAPDIYREKIVELSGKIKKHALVLDVACGSGLSSDTISKEYGFGVISCDVSSGMLSKAKAKVNGRLSAFERICHNRCHFVRTSSIRHFLECDSLSRRGCATSIRRKNVNLPRTSSHDEANTNITCQFHEKRAGKDTQSFTGCCIGVLQGFRFNSHQPHETSAQRWFLCLSNNRSSVDKKRVGRPRTQLVDLCKTMRN